MDIKNKDELLAYLAREKRIKYVFFWGHTNKNKALVNKTCFSQWYPSSFELDGVTYQTAEHYMMAEKARIFGNSELVSKIIEATNPSKAKALGRQVTGFTNEIWNRHRFEVVVRGNLAKFSQNKTMKEYLLSTNRRVLVEASPADNIWGIGLTEDHKDASNPFKWKGLNLLGFALMEVRKLLKE
ncbi:NADAR family protein [Aliikangiella marina]|uniref:NADAR family protein n=1 Tax=Aliikangiella marina TaxID=1712262 RepID=A0A545T4V6_9GAMM|nr:NADAR family protein [Aliikangiella marina]TQV72243.1 NADAR family protein [Aliikangiella marina]